MPRCNKKTLLWFGGLLLCAAVLPIITPQVHAAEIPLQVRLPGTSLCADPANAGRYCVNDIGEYILNFYRWFVSVTGVLAVAMVVLGGYKWMTAAGNSSKISDAQDIMNSAFSGIILVMLSFLFLQLINPSILSLRLPVSDISKINFTVGQQFCAGRVPPEKIPSTATCGTQLQLSTEEGGGTCIYEGNCSGGNICSLISVNDNTWGCQSASNACRAVDTNYCTWIDGQLVNNTNPDLAKYSCLKADISGAPDGCVAGPLLPDLYVWDGTPANIDPAKNGCTAFVGSPSARVQCGFAGLEDIGSVSTSCWDTKDGPHAGDPLASGATSWCSDSPRANTQVNSACCAYYTKEKIDCSDDPKKDVQVDCAYYDTQPGKYDSGGSGPDTMQVCTKKCWMDVYIYAPGREQTFYND